MTKKVDEAWLAEIEGVKPLSAGRDKAKPTKPVAAFEWGMPKAEEWGPAPGGKALAPLVILSDTLERLAGMEANGDPKLLKDMGAGKVVVSAQLDLHGFKEGDGWQMLLNWLHEAAGVGHRCVLVICGKGKGYGERGDMGVFRSQMGRVLAHHPRVLAFHTALPGDGGAGAVYVYLRRVR